MHKKRFGPTKSWSKWKLVQFKEMSMKLNTWNEYTHQVLVHSIPEDENFLKEIFGGLQGSSQFIKQKLLSVWSWKSRKNSYLGYLQIDTLKVSWNHLKHPWDTLLTPVDSNLISLTLFDALWHSKCSKDSIDTKEKKRVRTDGRTDERTNELSDTVTSWAAHRS